jgi:TolB-like protein/cytochrome c-type biogenesis protein CcmH/NrfG
VQGPTESAFSFEGYTLDIGSGSVRAGGRAIELRPKSFEVLCCLLENAGRLVSKEELIKCVWANPGVTDESVAKCVSDVRLALGDSDQRFIKTVTRRGYIFVAPVSRHEGRETPQSSAETISLIVLPFANLSGDADYDCVGGGITEGLTSYLSRMSTNFVIARSPMIFDGPAEADARQIGRELNVRYLLAGSHQHARERVRVSARLIDARTGAHLWADQFDTDRTELLDLQDIIVTRLARMIQIELAALEAARISQAKPTRADAEALARRGEAVFLKYGPNRAEAESGYELCERALAVDPSNARALSILAEKFATRITASQSHDRDNDLRRAEELVSRALASEPDSYCAHHAKARLLVAQKRPEEALVEAQRALAFNPSFIPAYQILCMVSLFTGRPDQIIGYADKAAQLSPADPFRYIFYAFTAYGHVMLDNKPAAIECLRQAIANNPNFPTPLAWLAALLALAGQTTEARDTLQRYLALSGAKTRTVAQWKATSWSYNPAYLAFRDLLYEGLRIAGMPEE